MKILKIFLLLSSLFILANADDDNKKYKHSYKNLEYLQLNNKQIEEIKDILIDSKRQYKEFYEYKEDKENILEDIMKADVFNENLYIQILNEIKTKASLLEGEKMKKIHNILDKMQREKFSKYLEEWEVE